MAPDAGGQGRAGADGVHRVRPLRGAARRGSPSSAPTRSRRWRRSSAPFEAFHRRTAPVRLARGPGQGVRRGRAGRRLLPRDRGVPGLRHPHDHRREPADAGQSVFVVDRVRAAIEADPRVGGRLALWGRRLMGEALSQAQRVAAERDALARCSPAAWTGPAMDLAAIGRLFTRLTENHSARAWRSSASPPDPPARPLPPPPTRHLLGGLGGVSAQFVTGRRAGSDVRRHDAAPARRSDPQVSAARRDAVRSEPCARRAAPARPRHRRSPRRTSPRPTRHQLRDTPPTPPSR